MPRPKSRTCTHCHNTATRSITGICITCRPPDAAPAVYRDRNAITFAGITLTTAQALTLANALVDAVEGTTHD